MLEAQLGQALLLKQLIDSIKELVTDVNFEMDEEGLKLQAMDNSHVALVALLLQEKGFNSFRCDRNMALGVNVASLQKVIKCAGNDDIVTLRAQEDSDLLNMVFETKNTDRVAEYEMKLMEIDTERLGIPDTVYDAEVTLPASEFSRIVRDLKELGESVRIEATKEGIKFSAEGDIGKASVTLKQTSDARSTSVKPVKKQNDDEDEEMKGEDDENEEEEVVVTDKKPIVVNSDDEEQEVVEQKDEKKPIVLNSDDDEEVVVEEGKSSSPTKKRKPKTESNGKAKKTKTEPAATKSKGKGKKKKKSSLDSDEEDGDGTAGADDERKVSISLQQSVSLTFSIKYLANFTKAAPLAKYVRLHMSNEVPLLVEYDFDIGYVRYYLAPKIADD